MIITQTPLRISLLGGNTDFPKYYKKYDGAVLTVAIDKYVYCIVKKRFDKQIWINYSIKEIVDDVKDIKHDLVREAIKLVGVKDSVEITFLSDVPSEGSGLGSSSAVTVGLLNALYHFKGENVTTDRLYKEACNIEIDILKKPIGIQDQLITAHGGCKMFRFGENWLRYMPLSDHFEQTFKDHLMLFYTGKTRKAEKILSKMKLNKRILDKNKTLVDKGVDAMNYYDAFKFANLLNDYWLLKKKLNKSTTNRTIDRLYNKALKAGAWGGKIVGAGGGGFLLLVVYPIYKANVRKALGLRELPFNISRTGSRVIFDIT